MGTQQLLLIVLGVIVVGIAITVGILMFNRQAMLLHRQEIVAQMNNYVTDALAYKRTPRSLGGGSGTFWGFNPTGSEEYSAHIGSPANTGLRIITPTVNYFIEYWAEGSYPQRIKIIASSKVYGQGNSWSNTYNARITANYDANGQIIIIRSNANLNGYMISGDWKK